MNCSEPLSFGGQRRGITVVELFQVALAVEGRQTKGHEQQRPVRLVAGFEPALLSSERLRGLGVVIRGMKANNFFVLAPDQRGEARSRSSHRRFLPRSNKRRARAAWSIVSILLNWAGLAR